MARLSYVVLVQKLLSLQNRQENSMPCPIHRQTPKLRFSSRNFKRCQPKSTHPHNSKQTRPPRHPKCSDPSPEPRSEPPTQKSQHLHFLITIPTAWFTQNRKNCSTLQRLATSTHLQTTRHKQAQHFRRPRMSPRRRMRLQRPRAELFKQVQMLMT